MHIKKDRHNTRTYGRTVHAPSIGNFDKCSKTAQYKCSILYLEIQSCFFFFIKMGSLTVQPKYFKLNISVEDTHIAESDCIISEIYRISDEIYKLPQ